MARLQGRLEGDPEAGHAVVEGPAPDAEQLGIELARRLLASGAGELLAELSDA